MKRYKVTCPFCECSFEIGESDSVNCMCGVLAHFENGHLESMRGGADEHYFHVENLLTGEVNVEREIEENESNSDEEKKE